ncbi:MAG: hypothetical protein PW789_10170 [Edaphobacter sp.]|uniref:hypothetical protein n=1 Tax=Edaphobacter sp. TaxID=1934404 RepID=UPI0023A00EB0|nr:hypothetical protein [Edaphobacter sp.]MDE1176957.1 hypothetical protein [Edaphobacter sp.]
MHFQAVERVPEGDAEHVLAVLEQQSRRRVAGGVEREGRRLILSGLGPSPRTINLRDMTVIEVRPEEGGTMIDAEVSFQASSLMAPLGQEEIVRGKLQRIFGATKEQLEAELTESGAQRTVPVVPRREVVAPPVREVASPAREFEVKPAAAAPAERRSETRAEVEAAVSEAAQAPLPVASPVAKDLPAAKNGEAEKSAAAVASVLLPVQEVQESLPAQESQAAQESKTEAGAAAAEAQTEAVAQAQAQATVEDDPAEPNRPWLRWVVAAGLVLAAAPFVWRAVQPKQAAPVIQLEKAQVAKPVPPPVDAGPEGALRQWELAMRSSDAASQVAYYAVPVEQYMWKHNVSRHDLEVLKQAEIAKRRGLWTEKMENVKVDRKGDIANISLLKHVMEQPQGGHVRERWIPSRLTLKRSMGIWWITSEHDIYPKKIDDAAGTDGGGQQPSGERPAPPAVAATATPSAASTN